jgi:hypothetical protein
MDWHPALMRHVEAACGDQRVQGRDWFRMPPTLLAGDDGVGRTHIARRIARSAGLPHVVFDLADPRIGCREAPPEVPEPVPPLVAMAISRCANPLVSVVNADTASPVALALITRLVDPRANRRVVATALGAQLDLGQVSWLVQSSAPDSLPHRLTDLLVRVDLEDPDGEDTDFVAIDLMAEVVADLGLPPPYAGTVDAILSRYRSRQGYPSAHVGVGEMYAQIAARLQSR